MPIQEAPLRVFRTFICMKRIPPSPLFYYVLPRSLPISFPRLLADVYFLLHPLSESTSTFCSLRPSISAQHAYSLFHFYTSFCSSSLYLSTLSPYTSAPPLRHILLISSLCFSEELECLLYARISLLNLVLQVTILLLSPFSSWYFSCRYSTLLLFLVNAFVFVTERTSGSSPLFFCIR